MNSRSVRLPRSLALPFAYLSLFALLVPRAGAQPLGSLDALARPIPGRSMRASSSNVDLAKNGDARSLAPGETLELANLEGPGAITHMWCTVASQDPFYGRSLVLRFYWDGAEKPSVVAPLGDFFGVGHGGFSEFASTPVAVSSGGRSRNCYWNMPFRSGARVTLTNDSTEYRTDSFYYYLDWRRDETIPEDAPRFHALYRQNFPAAPGHHPILETEGRGHYVGTVLSSQLTDTGWYGEGDDFFYLDGEELPSLRGTGTEDYFGDAWGFRKFSTPWHGVSMWEGYFPGDRVTAYRWHVPDPVVFERSLRVEMEHRGSVFTDFGVQLGTFVERPDWVSSVAFWYQHPARGLDDALPPATERVAPYRVIRGADLKGRVEPPGGFRMGKDGIGYLGPNAEARVEVDFEVAEDGRYQISAFLAHSLVGARCRPMLDGAPVGPELDLWADGMDVLPVSLDLHDLKAGPHVLAFQGLGPSPRKRSRAPGVVSFGMTHLLLLRLEDMAGYREALEGAMKR